jgi:hypothetical protein
VVNFWEVGGEVQGEYALQNGNYGFLSVRHRRTNILNYNQAKAGYEHFWNDRWGIGGTARYDYYRVREYPSGERVMQGEFVPEVFLRHSGKVGSFNLRQRLGVEYNFPETPNEGRALGRLRLDVDRLVPIGRVVLRPRLAYEGFAYLRLQRDENEPKERVIDFTALRAEIGCRVSDHFDFTPWLAYQTAYTNVLQQTDASGNVVIRGGRRNFVTPVLGLDLRYTIFQGKQVFERRQLPTQH